MNLFGSILAMAFGALRQNLLRSVLTCLGITIGIAAVIAMMEIGNGSSQSIERTIASLGAGVIQIDSIDVSLGGVSTGRGGSMDITIEDADALRRECSVLRRVAPSVDSWGQVIAGNRNWHAGRILGSTPDYLSVRNWRIAQGEPFTTDDVRSSACVCLIGQTIREKLFGDDSPIGKELRLRGVALKVVGLLAPKGANVMGGDEDDFLLIPLTTVKYRIMGVRQATQATVAAAAPAINTLDQVYPGQQAPLYPIAPDNRAVDTPQLARFTDIDDMWVSAGSEKNIALAIKQVRAVLRDRHHIKHGGLDDFRIRNLTEISQTFAETSRVMTHLLLAVALISLAVGGVGIMNIMLVSVTERTREIGVRRAIGAKARDILRQFLSEAVVLCMVGGMAGILLGRGVSVAITELLHWPTVLSVPAIIAAVAVCCTIGVIFGFYPAWKASRLNPIEALRYE